MIGSSVRNLVAISSIAVAVSGCVHHHHHDEVVVGARIYVDAPPPVERVEVIPPRPSPDHVWVKGYYAWRHGVYEWEPGRYIIAPHREAVWMPGHWDREGGRYFWVEGHWR